MEPGLPLGEFTCPITFESIRPPKPVVKEEDGVTYVVQGDYEITFQGQVRTLLDNLTADALAVGRTAGRTRSA